MAGASRTSSTRANIPRAARIFISPRESTPTVGATCVLIIIQQPDRCDHPAQDQAPAPTWIFSTSESLETALRRIHSGGSTTGGCKPLCSPSDPFRRDNRRQQCKQRTIKERMTRTASLKDVSEDLDWRFVSRFLFATFANFCSSVLHVQIQ
jgi:hypothetical protein